MEGSSLLTRSGFRFSFLAGRSAVVVGSKASFFAAPFKYPYFPHFPSVLPSSGLVCFLNSFTFRLSYHTGHISISNKAPCSSVFRSNTSSIQYHIWRFFTFVVHFLYMSLYGPSSSFSTRFAFPFVLFGYSSISLFLIAGICISHPSCCFTEVHPLLVYPHPPFLSMRYTSPTPRYIIIII